LGGARFVVVVVKIDSWDDNDVVITFHVGSGQHGRQLSVLLMTGMASSQLEVTAVAAMQRLACIAAAAEE
jgi:hypothetical protein